MQLKSIRCSVIRRNFQSNLYVSFINQTIKNKKTKHVIALLHIYTARCSRYSFIHGCHSELNQQRIKQQTYRELMFHTHIFNNNIYWNRISIIRISPHIFDVYSRYTFGKSNAFIRKSRKKYVFVDGARSALSTQMKLFFVFFYKYTSAHHMLRSLLFHVWMVYYYLYDYYVIGVHKNVYSCRYGHLAGLRAFFHRNRYVSFSRSFSWCLVGAINSSTQQ